MKLCKWAHSAANEGLSEKTRTVLEILPQNKLLIRYVIVSEQMSAQWINFICHGDPNAEGLPDWPTYNDYGENGLNLVLQTESQGQSYVEEDTYRLAGREYLTQWARRRHV